MNILIKNVILNIETQIKNNTIKKERVFDRIIKPTLTENLNNELKNNAEKVYVKANNIKQSYFNRFLKTNKRHLYFKTIKQQYRIRLEHIQEIFQRYIENNIPRLEKKEKFKRMITNNISNFVPMIFRIYCYIKVFVTHKIKNTFVTIYKGLPKDNEINRFKTQVINKFSCGLVGYKGPKKSTVFARKEVVKEAGLFLGSLMTSLVSVVFTTRVNRWNRKTVRNLCPNLSYILTISIPYKRSHGNLKHPNRRRV